MAKTKTKTKGKPKAKAKAKPAATRAAPATARRTRKAAPKRAPAQAAAAGVTIWHNPACGTSRSVLAMIRAAGIEPVVIEYLKTPPSRETLAATIRRMGVPVRALLRQKGTPYDELGLGDAALSDDRLLDAMMAHPILINRPVVITAKGARLCRPPETVAGLLP